MIVANMHKELCQLFHCIRQVAADNGLDGILTMVATPSLFFNECEVHFQFNWKSLAELPGDVIVQVIMHGFPKVCSALNTKMCPVLYATHTHSVAVLFSLVC